MQLSGASGRRPGQRPLGGAVALLALVSLVYLTISMNRAVNLYDEGMVLFDAQRVLNGDVPHRDFFTVYGPAQYYILAALYKLFGASVLVERAWDTVIRCCCVLLLFIIVEQAAPRINAVLAALAGLVWLSAVGCYGYIVFPTLAMALAGAAFLAPVLAAPMRAPPLVAAGLCAGLASLFGYDLGIGLFVSECGVVAFTGWLRPAQDARLRTTAVSLTCFCAGFAVVTVPVAAAYALGGVIPGLVFDLFTYAGHNYVKMRSLPFPGASALLNAPRRFDVYLPPLLCAAAVPSTVPLLWPGQGRSGRDCATGPATTVRPIVPWSLLLLIVVTLVSFGKGTVRVSTIHMSMALVASTALAGVLAQSTPKRSAMGRAMMLATVLIGGAYTLISIHAAVHQIARNAAWVEALAADPPTPPGASRGYGICHTPAGLDRVACFSVSPEEAATIQYIRDNTHPDEPFFSGVVRNDKIFINDVFIYFAVARRSATMWHEFNSGLQSSASIQDKMVTELLHESPRLIVLESTWDKWNEPNGSAISSGVHILDDYLRSNYEPIATFGTAQIWRIRSQGRR